MSGGRGGASGCCAASSVKAGRTSSAAPAGSSTVIVAHNNTNVTMELMAPRQNEAVHAARAIHSNTHKQIEIAIRPSAGSKISWF